MDGEEERCRSHTTIPCVLLTLEAREWPDAPPMLTCNIPHSSIIMALAPHPPHAKNL